MHYQRMYALWPLDIAVVGGSRLARPAGDITPTRLVYVTPGAIDLLLLLLLLLREDVIVGRGGEDS